MYSEPKVVELYNLYSVENRKLFSNLPLRQFLIQCTYFFNYSTILPILLSFVTTFAAALAYYYLHYHHYHHYPRRGYRWYRVAYHLRWYAVQVCCTTCIPFGSNGGKKMVIGYG